MALVKKAENFKGPNDVKITIVMGDTDKITLEELEEADIPAVADIARRAAIQDTANLMLRAYNAHRNGDPMETFKEQQCVKNHLDELIGFLETENTPQAAALAEYDAITQQLAQVTAGAQPGGQDKALTAKQKQLTQQLVTHLYNFCEKMPTKDLYINYTNLGPTELKTKADYFMQGLRHLVKEGDIQLVQHEPENEFEQTVEDMVRANMDRRSITPRQAYWMVIKKEGKPIGMTLISSAPLKSDDVGKTLEARYDKDGNVIEEAAPIREGTVTVGHCGSILDPNFQRRGYAVAAKTVMVDMMYDTKPELKQGTITRGGKNVDALFYSTCNELNVASTGMQRKIGNRAVMDGDDLAVRDGKIHWYATAAAVDECILQPQTDRITYRVETAQGSYDKRPGFTQQHFNEQKKQQGKTEMFAALQQQQQWGMAQ